MKNYEPVMGLEVHIELNTRSKMFCRCSADYFGKEPNTHTCPICLGLPGALPFINKEAINKCLQIGLALNCKVSPVSYFERKNYFYPDLAKGYQISQYRWPLCINGQWTIDNGKLIRINRVHQEEDTGKLSHPGGVTLIDFNRSGVPLVEIVTEPDFKDVTEVRDYARKLQQLFRNLNVSNADMEKGDMRLEANISVRPVRPASQTTSGSVKLPDYRVELKNINSFRFMAAAIEYEIKRQITSIEKGEKLLQETRGWDEDKKCTYLQRSKEEAHDYRYFPEPDLPELKMEQSRVQSLESNLPELPWEKVKRFEEIYEIKKADAMILTESRKLAEFFETAVHLGQKYGISGKEVANYIVNRKTNINSPTQIIEELKQRKVGVIGDTGSLEKLAKRVIDQNAKSVADYKAGKEKAIQALIGGVMRLSSGKADISKLKSILEKLLKK